ncbi:hypothetical protein [Phreatobacter stygius]|uniref:hypothetical protein n=1 Tax=Phreatobacter stygius TaxID=1940610 RepID=UPI001476A620|nr:hypothetical protein [Phreatobacter stygius]
MPPLQAPQPGFPPPVPVAQQPTPQVQPNPQWGQMPRMQLERQFAGPLRDTVIQRWRDPADGSICYIYLPITAAHSPPVGGGFVQYGSNTIGTISCTPGPAPRSAVAPARQNTAAAARPATQR